MSPQPGPNPHTPATTAGQHHIEEAAAGVLGSIEQIMHKANTDIAAEQTPRIPTFYKDPTKPPAIGTAPPVQQPGRPAMSQKATDDSVRMLSFGGMVLFVGVGISAVMLASGRADPVVLAVGGGSLIGLVLALCKLMRGAREVVEAAPPQITQHYSGDVHQDHTQITTSTRGVIAYSRNNLPN